MIWSAIDVPVTKVSLSDYVSSFRGERESRALCSQLDRGWWSCALDLLDRGIRRLRISQDPLYDCSQRRAYCSYTQHRAKPPDRIRPNRNNFAYMPHVDAPMRFYLSPLASLAASAPFPAQTRGMPPHPPLGRWAISGLKLSLQRY